MNKVNSTLGSYLPFFFHMEVSFPFPSRIHPMERLDERFLSIYIYTNIFISFRILPPILDSTMDMYIVNTYME